MGLNCGIPSLIILLFMSVSGTLDVNVSCSPQTICALRESEVDLKCSYSNITIKTVFWFSFKEKAKWRNEEHPEDLALDSDYAGRVYYSPTTNTSSTLTIRELRERDSGEYLLMIITEQGEKHLSPTAVSLRVTDPQVKMNSGTFSQPEQTLTCITSCNFTAGPLSYTWNKNGQKVKGANQISLALSSKDAGSYSCSVASSYVEISSNAVCVFDQDCWNVTYTDRRVCVLEGSSVDFPCTYSHPSGYSFNDAFWHSRWFVEEPMDLRQEEQFAGRVEYIGVKERNHTLTMKDVRKNDSGEYYFRFITKTKGGKFSGRPGVILNVTGLQVRVISSTASDGQTVTLMCSSTCTLPNNPTYMWYKYGQPVTNKLSRDNKLYLKCSEDAGNYSCAVRGHEELRSPDQTLSDCPEESSGSKQVSVGVVLFLVLILGIAALWMFWAIRRKRGAERDSDIQTPDPADHTYTALNPTTTSSDYDTLTHITGPPSDTYTALNPATRCSDYATLTLLLKLGLWASALCYHPWLVMAHSSGGPQRCLGFRCQPHFAFCGLCTWGLNTGFMLHPAALAGAWVSEARLMLPLMVPVSAWVSASFMPPLMALNTAWHSSSSGTMGFKCGVLSLIILLVFPVAGTLDVSVSCSPLTICALRESEVELSCSYSNISFTIKSVFWFSFKQKAKWRNEEHPEDVALDSDYAGRVSTESTDSNSTLTLRELRESDSGGYRLLIITEQGEKHLSSTAVSLTVTDLQVRLNSGSEDNKQTLACNTSCNLTSDIDSYTWYKNAVKVESMKNQMGLLSYSKDAGSYSCSISSHEEIHSNAVCVFSRNCWSVTYTDRRVCVLAGSSVDFSCNYLHPKSYNFLENFWHYNWFVGQPKNLRHEEQFTDRVEYAVDEERKSTLRIRDVRKNDSGEYYFRIITKPKEGKFSGKPGVILNVTALQVRVIPSTASDGQTVTLVCSTTCTLPNNPTYIWYKNGQPVTNKLTRDNKLYLKCSGDAGNYSCAVRGHEELRSPDQTLSDSGGGPKKSSVLIAVGVVVILLIILITAAALWVWTRKSKGGRSSGASGQHDSAHVYDNTSAMDMTSDPTSRVSDNHEDVHYSSVQFKPSHSQEKHLSSRHPEETIKEQDVEYAAVNFNRHTVILYEHQVVVPGLSFCMGMTNIQASGRRSS
ncbi:hypothetical protein AOLI_G00289120 [Acnodon oligacanthus]